MPVRQFNLRPVPALTLLALLFVPAGVATWRDRERIVIIAPRVSLSWGGQDGDPLYDAQTPKGLEPSPGGRVMVSDVAATEVVERQHVIGRDTAGTFFLLSLRDLRHYEPAEELLQRFASQEQWRDACRAAGITDLSLRHPKAVAD